MSNFSIKHIEELKAAGLPMPAANQIELHPWSQKPELVRYLDDNAITPIAYSSLVPLSTWRTAEGQDSAKTDQMKADGEQADAPFKVMARKYGVSEAQVLLRWAIQKGYPVLPKSTNPDRIRKNADIFGFNIDDEDMAAIDEDGPWRRVAWAWAIPRRPREPATLRAKSFVLMSFERRLPCEACAWLAAAVNLKEASHGHRRRQAHVEAVYFAGALGSAAVLAVAGCVGPDDGGADTVTSMLSGFGWRPES